MSQSNIYAAKENGDLRLVAEIEGESDPALAVDALLDEMPRLKQRSFIVINMDSVVLVEASDEIVQPRRKMTISSGNNVGAAVVEDEDEDVEDEEPEAEEAPAPSKQRRRPAARKPAAKPAASKPANGRRKTAAPAKRASTRKSSPFKSNPASAE